LEAKVELEINIINGTQRDAILHSVGANATHGLRRSNQDKRKAVVTLLEDNEWCQWSDAFGSVCLAARSTTYARSPVSAKWVTNLWGKCVGN